jgi:predicted nucleic acid-binding protein
LLRRFGADWLPGAFIGIDSIFYHKRRIHRVIPVTRGGPCLDAMIAATARFHGLVVATRNERDFAQFDVKILNPFKY